MTDFAVVVPWLDADQIDLWMRAWKLHQEPDWLLLTQDETRAGCAATKNRGIVSAINLGADVVIVLDDDCFPAERSSEAVPKLEEFARAHVAALDPQPVTMFETVTEPPSRGTPFRHHTAEMPVAASMGFWTEIGDYDSVRQLAHNSEPMTFRSGPIFGRYFPLSGMNLAFRPAEWEPWWTFIDVPRFDDIWMGWMWQREAISRGACFNLNGPTVRHVRQSNVWRNLQVEARHLERNETLWADIATHPDPTYENLVALLPSDPGGSDR